MSKDIPERPAFYPPPTDRRYAVVCWQIGDVQSLFQLTDDEAHEFLQRNAHAIQDRLIEVGWDVLDTLGSMEGLSKRVEKTIEQGFDEP